MQEKFFLRAQALAISSTLMLPPQHDPTTHKHLLHSLVLGHAREYFRTTQVLAPFSLAPTSFETILAFTILNLDLDGFFLFFLEDHKLDQNLKLSYDFFKLAFQCMSHLSINGHYGMVFERI
jgi:hypothetical protein